MYITFTAHCKSANEAVQQKQTTVTGQWTICTRDENKIQAAMSLFGKKPMYSVAATKKQHEREAPTEGVRGRTDRK